MDSCWYLMLLLLHRSTHAKLSDELDALRTLSSSALEPSQLHHLHSEVISLKAKMGMELEALSRFVQIVNATSAQYSLLHHVLFCRSIGLTSELTNTLSFQLKANSWFSDLLAVVKNQFCMHDLRVGVWSQFFKSIHSWSHYSSNSV